MSGALSMQVFRPVFRLLVAGALFALLAGCAANRAYSEGNTLFAAGKTEEGLAKIAEAARLDPGNIEYRIALVSRRASLINRLIASGDAFRRDGRLLEAENAYRNALAQDPNNAMGRQGLDAIAIERRHRQTLADAQALLAKGTADDLAAAADKLRWVLSENPASREAQDLSARIEQAGATSAAPEGQLGAAYKRPISIEFRDAPMRSVFDFISRMSGLNIFFDREVKTDQKVSVLARNTSVEDAVRILLATNQLDKKVLNQNSILVFPGTAQKLREYQSLSVRTFYLTNADVKVVANTLKTLIKTRDMVVDERLSLIILRDTPEAIRLAERIVALQDLGDPEVVLEVEVMEVKRTRLQELGIQWPGQVTLAPISLQGGAALTLADLRRFGSSNVQVTTDGFTLSAHGQDQDANLLANPRIRVRNKEKAKILIGDRVPIITTTSTSTGFVSEAVNYVDVGLKLEVEPTIHLDEEVAIKVNLEVSSLVNQVVSKGGSLSYQIGTRGANTVLRLKDGETQILAGLISDEDRSSANKVPGIGELPIAGRLFGSRNENVQRGEVLLSITPRIVRSNRRASLAKAEFESGTEASVGAEPLRLRSIAGDGQGNPMRASASSTGETQGPVGAPAMRHVETTSQRGSSANPQQAVVAEVPLVVPTALHWQVRPQVKVGEQFTAQLHIRSQSPVSALPVVIAYDPKLLQLVSTTEGSFFSQNAGKADFSFRVDESAGQVSVSNIRLATPADGAGAAGSGSVVMLTFVALQANVSSSGGSPSGVLRVVSATPEPSPLLPVVLPADQPLRITP